MKMIIPEYNGSYKIISLALDEESRNDLLEEEVLFWYVNSEGIMEYPTKCVVSEKPDIVEFFFRYNNYDVFEIWENGTVKCCYNDKSPDTTFFITGRCNSNCIMCPSPENSRKGDSGTDVDKLITIASHMPIDTRHVTITGGEPFLIGKDIFRLLEYCRDKFIGTEFLILTNGRVFAVNDYCDLLQRTAPHNCLIGIPLHGAKAETHDGITQSKGSFSQTLRGIKTLLNIGMKIEIRIVVNRLNCNEIKGIAQLIIDELQGVAVVTIMAMEMTGSAYINRDKIWISYSEAFASVKPAVLSLVYAGIDVRLYNFPLCTVDRDLWPVCAKSISDYKIRYAEGCRNCSIKDACGGVFAGTINLERTELKPIHEI